MNNFQELSDFIKNNKNWQELLKKEPYNLRSVTQCSYNDDWYILMYNLFSSDLSNKIVHQCRGTVVDSKGNILCAPYLKFFDINDTHAAEMNWKSNKLSVISKIDGQLVKCFKKDGQVYWTSNGSFDMSIEITGNEFLDFRALLFNAISKGDKSIKRVDDNRLNVISNDKNCWLNKMQEGWTYMFELTSPYNKIICSYDEVKLWFHGCRDSNGFEHDPLELNLPYESPTRYNLKSRQQVLDALKMLNGEKQEGFVVCDMENWTRVKMKCESYLKLKFVRDYIDNPKAIFELVTSGEFDDLQKPEFQEKIQELLIEIHNLQNRFELEWNYSKKLQEKYKTKKDFALFVNENIPDILKPFYFNSWENDFMPCWDKIMNKLKLENGWRFFNDLLLFYKN